MDLQYYKGNRDGLERYFKSMGPQNEPTRCKNRYPCGWEIKEIEIENKLELWELWCDGVFEPAHFFHGCCYTLGEAGDLTL